MGNKIEMYPAKKFEADFLKKARKQLLGRTISNIRFMTEEEMNNNGWSQRGIVFILDDGNIIYPMSDEEGNDSGAMGTSYNSLEVIGRI